MAEVCTAMSGKAALSATIDAITISTSRLATVSSQIRRRFDRAVTATSISWAEREEVSTMSASRFSRA